MAIRFDAVGDQLNRTANLPPNGSFTYMMWTAIDNELAGGTYQPYLWALDATSQQGYACGVINGIFDIECYNAGAVASSSSVASRPAAGQAACVYVRCSGTGANLINAGYRLAGANAFISSGNATLGSLNPMTQLYLGGLFGAYWMDGRRWNIKCWDRALTDSEILIESYFEKPQYPGSLNFYYPLYNVNDLNDKSGNGRNPTTAGTLTTADSLVNMWRPKQRYLRALAATSSSGPVGRADETDLALALLGSQSLALGLASETDLALALLGSQALGTGRADEVDSALSLTANTTGNIGLASETDTAFALGSGTSAAVGLAEETDTALALTGSQSLALGLATEVDTAFALLGSQSLPVGLATEVDSAFALVGTIPGGVGLAEETDTAFALAGSQSMGVGLATEADAALALLGSQLLNITPADETDVAFSLTASTILSAGLAVSFEQAFALTAFTPSAIRNAYALEGNQVALCPIRYWNGSQWVNMEYRYWAGSDWITAPENQLP